MIVYIKGKLNRPFIVIITSPGFIEKTDFAYCRQHNREKKPHSTILHFFATFLFLLLLFDADHCYTKCHVFKTVPNHFTSKPTLANLFLLSCLRPYSRRSPVIQKWRQFPLNWHLTFQTTGKKLLRLLCRPLMLRGKNSEFGDRTRYY